MHPAVVTTLKAAQLATNQRLGYKQIAAADTPAVTPHKG
jgi:hypothetical protein